MRSQVSELQNFCCFWNQSWILLHLVGTRGERWNVSSLSLIKTLISHVQTCLRNVLFMHKLSSVIDSVVVPALSRL